MPPNSKKLCAVKIESIKSSFGDNVCLTMLSCFNRGHSLLAGVYNQALFLTSGGSNEVDAGCVSTYVLCTDDKTKYLGDLRPGDELLTVNFAGKMLSNKITQIKTEQRQMLMINAKYTVSGREIFDLLKTHGEHYFNGYRSIFRLQNTRTGKPISVLDISGYRDRQEDICAFLNVGTIFTDSENNLITCVDGRQKPPKKLNLGERILAYVQMPGVQSRHFGMAYDGVCIER